MPAGIIIVGLGPGDSQHWTQAAATILHQADKIYLRTSHHPSLANITAQTHSFDDLFGEKDFDQTLNQIAAEIVRQGQRDGAVVYAVPGHPEIDEPSVPHILALAKTKQIPVTVVPGLSLLDAARAVLKLPGRLQIVEAAEVARLHHPPLAPDHPALIMRLHRPSLAVKVKQTLLNVYPDDLVVTLIQFTGAQAGQKQPLELVKNNSSALSASDKPQEQNYLHTRSLPLAELERHIPFDGQTILYLPADAANASFTTLQETVAHLRAPEEGCPWDQKQTHQSLRPFLLEETYEVLETLDANEPMALAEELGDLLLQIMLHTQIATDTGEFKMGTVIDHINCKLVRRHPHVFGRVVVKGAEEVAVNWEAIKQAEKNAKGQPAQAPSALDGVPPALPALTQALSISKRAVRAGFEWPNIEGVLEHLIEEAREVTEANNPIHLEAEIGDLLFSLVNLARWRNIDPESALRGTNARFTRRFKKMEALAAEKDKNLPDLSPTEMQTLWNEAKRYES
ncbi:MAG: nucleoside triphosphate pyrophosphohydrolase [Anaerolineae bacterium]|nr:nucleoside triphosphate pyrophosphohydrolase [Anaerolineae bacterium]